MADGAMAQDELECDGNGWEESVFDIHKYRGQGGNWKDSAEKAKTNYKRLREYVKQHPDCKTYQKDIRNTKLEERDNLLIDSAPEAVKTLRDIMRDPRNRAYTRIEAARTLLSENRSSVSEVDIKEGTRLQVRIVSPRLTSHDY